MSLKKNLNTSKKHCFQFNLLTFSRLFYTLCRTLESENFLPKQSNVDLLQEIEHILTEQTPILAALEKQNGDKSINGDASFSGASGRVSATNAGGIY